MATSKLKGGFMIIRIDGREIYFEGSKTVLEIARENGIYIPALCAHPSLVPFAGCRLCLVEVKGRRGFIPSCTLAAEDGMEVVTNSAVLQEARRQTLELILSEHPYACLICSEKEACEENKSTIRKVNEVTGCIFCPKNNHCELQEVVRSLDLKRVRFTSFYRNLDIHRDDPFFDRNYNLCILCGRCVRVCHEVRGASVISFVFRGAKTVISPAFERTLLASGCQFCGACVDVCPVGALTERAWRAEVKPEKETVVVCPFCGQGCQLKVKIKGQQVLATEPASDGPLNRGQACVRGRFLSREVVHSRHRLSHPLLRKNGALQPATWEEALEEAAQKISSYRGSEIGLVLSSQLPLEDLYLLTLFGQRGLGTENIALSSVAGSLSAWQIFQQEEKLSIPLNYKPEEINKAEVILILGGDLSVLQPVLWVDVYQAQQRGAQVLVLDTVERPYDRHAAQVLRVSPGEELAVFCRWLSLVAEKIGRDKIAALPGADEFWRSLQAIDAKEKIKTSLDSDLEKAASLLVQSSSTVILFGPDLTMNSYVAALSFLWNLALLVNAKIIPFGLESNSRGAWELWRRLSFWPRPWSQMEEDIASGKLKAVLCFGPLPSLSSQKPEFLMVVDAYHPELESLAEIVLPAATGLERAGTYVSGSGLVQRFLAAMAPLAESRPDWWVGSELARRLDATSVLRASESDLLRELAELFPEISEFLRPEKESYPVMEAWLSEPESRKKLVTPGRVELGLPSKKEPVFHLLTEANLDYYRSLHLAEESRDFSLLRQPRWVKIHPEEAAKLGLKDGEKIIIKNEKSHLGGILKISPRVPAGVIVLSLTLSSLPEFSPAPFIASCFSRQADGRVMPEAVTIERGS